MCYSVNEISIGGDFLKIVSSFGNRIKQYREDNNLTLAEIERMTDVPAQTINRYELGQRVPKVDAAAIIADKLNLNPLWLFGYDVEDADASSRLFEFTKHEQDVIMEYRNHPDMQSAVDRILGVEPELFSIAKVARGQKDLKLTKEQMKEFAESAKKAPNRSQDKDLF